MRQRVRLVESSLREMIKESVRQVLREGHYEDEYDRTGSPLDDESYVESFEYIIDSLINGNFRQANEMIQNLTPSEVVELLDMAREANCERELRRALNI